LRPDQVGSLRETQTSFALNGVALLMPNGETAT
jgi:hypothetical protein